MNGAMTTLMDYLIEEMQALYYAEEQSALGLPTLARHATESSLREAFEQHAETTHRQVERLERIFAMLGREPKARPSDVLSELMGETEVETAEPAQDVTAQVAKDTALIHAAEKAGHYEIASYGYLYTYAQFLGLREVGELLALSLEEETEAAQTLAEIAELTGLTATQAAAAA